MTRTVPRGRSWTFPGHPRGPMRPWPITAQPGRRFSMAVTVPTATWATPGPSSWAVASDSTAWRLVAALDEEHLAKVRKARATAQLEGPGVAPGAPVHRQG